MENTSTTLLTDRCLLDERASLDNRRTESLVLHELAHQWFGDLVVIKHWSHAWIKEGMASYAEVLWTEHEYGEEYEEDYETEDEDSNEAVGGSDDFEGELEDEYDQMADKLADMTMVAEAYKERE